MRIRSPRRALRPLLLALAASAAPAALLPSLAQEWQPLTFPASVPVLERSSDVAAVEASRNLTIREFEDGPTPLEVGFFDLPGMGTADVLPEGAVLGYLGQNQANPSGAGGTGNQNYFFGAEVGIADRVQLGLTWNKFADPVTFAGASQDIFARTLSANAAYRFVDNGSLQVTARASAGYFDYRSAFHGSITGTGSRHTIGSFHLPMSVQVGTAGELMLVPGVSVFPKDINGVPFYGVLPQVGVGATVRLGQRLGFYGLVNVPFSVDGSGNTFDGTTGAPETVPVWTAGVRYMATPKAALDVYVTNGFWATPTTEILSFIPDGDESVLGVKFSYTPGWRYRASYLDIRPPTDRERRLQYRGLTMASADTLEAGTVLFSGGAGTNGHYQAGLRFSPDHDLEFGYAIEGLPDDGSRPPNRRLGSLLGKEDRWMIQGKIRFLDQNNGGPFSLSGNVEVGREWSTRFGVAYGSVPISYKFTPRIAATVEPKAAFYGAQRLYGVGVGVNAEVWGGLDLLAEVTPMAGGDPLTWAMGSRLHLDALGWFPASVDVQASNAIGTRAAGTMVAQDEIRYSVGIHIPLDGKRLFGGLF